MIVMVMARRKIIILFLAENYNFYNIDFFIFLMFFSSGIGSGPSGMAPWTPWIDRKIKKKFQKIDFLDIFFILDPWLAIFDHLDL